MTDIAHVTRLIEPEAQALGFDLVRVKLFGRGDERTLQIMAERPDTRQLTIDDCSELSRRVSDRFDALEAEGADPIEEAYRLEVSSPGIDRPLTRLKDFADWTGQEARITLAEKLDGQRTFKGDLTGVDGDSVLLRAAAGVVTALPFASIEDAKLVFTDRLLAATAPLSTEGADELVEAPAEDHEDPDVDRASYETPAEESN